MRKTVLACCTLALLAGFGVVVAQETKKEAPAQDAPQMEQPTAEHKWLQARVGVWDGDVEMYMDPTKPTKSKGVETITPIGSFWISCAVKGEIPGMGPFSGQGTYGYDVKKKKFVGMWVDSMTSYWMQSEGTVDATGKVLTMESEGPNCMEPGKTAKYRDVIEHKDADNSVYTSSMQGSDGKWAKMIQVVSKRKK